MLCMYVCMYAWMHVCVCIFIYRSLEIFRMYVYTIVLIENISLIKKFKVKFSWIHDILEIFYLEHIISLAIIHSR